MVLQNTTFGGIQGFTRRPATPWFDDDGNQARTRIFVVFVRQR